MSNRKGYTKKQSKVIEEIKVEENPVDTTNVSTTEATISTPKGLTEAARIKFDMECATIKEEISSVRKEKQNLEEKLQIIATEHTEKITISKQTIHDLTKENEKLEAEIKTLENAKSKFTSEHAQLEKKLEALKNEVSIIKKEKNTSEENHKAQATQLESQVSNLNKEITENDTQILSLQKKIKDLESASGDKEKVEEQFKKKFET